MSAAYEHEQRLIAEHEANKVYYEVIIEMRDGGWGDTDVWYDRLLLEQETTLQGMFTMVGEGKVVAIEVTTEVPNDLPI